VVLIISINIPRWKNTFGIIMLAIVGGKPEVNGLKRCLSFSFSIRTLSSGVPRFELRKRKSGPIFRRAQIALDHLDEIIGPDQQQKILAEAKEGLIRQLRRFRAAGRRSIEMRLQRLTGLERDKIISEYIETLKEIERLKSILASDALVSQIIKDELLEIKEKYADERKTEIVEDTGGNIHKKTLLQKRKWS